MLDLPPFGSRNSFRITHVVTVLCLISVLGCSQTDWSIDVTIDGQGSVAEILDGGGTGQIDCYWNDTSRCFGEYSDLNPQVVLNASPANGFALAEWDGLCYGFDAEIIIYNPVYPVRSGAENNTVRDIECTAIFVPTDTLPTAQFSITPNPVDAGQSVAFDASTSFASPPATLVSYEWDFGDGNTASGESTTHTYTQGAEYQVRLVVRDDADIPATLVQTLTVTGAANEAPIARFSATPNPANVNQIITFDASASTDDGSIISYGWDFDTDGVTDAYGVNVSNNYGAAGTYSASLTVIDDGGLTNTLSQQISVVNAGSIAITSAQITPYMGANDANLPHLTDTLVKDLVVTTDAPMSSLTVDVVGCTAGSGYDCQVSDNPPANTSSWALRLPDLPGSALGTAYDLQLTVQGNGGSDSTIVKATIYENLQSHLLDCTHTVTSDGGVDTYELSLNLDPAVANMYESSFHLLSEDPNTGFSYVDFLSNFSMSFPVTFTSQSSGPFLILAYGYVDFFVTQIQTSLYIPDLTTGSECPAL